MKIGIIGYGRMGKELSRRCLENGWEVMIINRSDDWLRLSQGVDIVCLCISTEDDGEAAYDYIRPLVENNIAVVTCEKGPGGIILLSWSHIWIKSVTARRWEGKPAWRPGLERK